MSTVAGVEKGRMDRLERVIPAALFDFSRRHEVPPSRVLRVAWALVLDRYNERPLAARHASSVLDWLRTEAATTEESDQFGEHTGATSQTPLGNVALFIEDEDRSGPPERSRTRQSATVGSQRLELTVTTSDRPAVLAAFDPDTWSADRVGRLIGHYVQAIANVVDHPHASLEDLHILTPEEYETLVVRFNQTAAPLPSVNGVHDLFEAQVSKTPNRPAVVFGDETITYSELNERAEELAAGLRAMGVGPEVIVGLCVPRSIEMVIAVIGVMKAGGAYAPIDPAYPRARVEFMLDDTAAPVVIATGDTSAQLPESATVVNIDSPPPPPQAGSPEQAQRAGPSNLAYVLYTSGSTGVPKGVLVTHHGLLNYVVWAADYYDAAGGSGSPVQSPLSFDLTVTSLFTPLVVGGTVHLLAEQSAVDSLGAALNACETPYSLVKITPAHLQVAGQHLSPERAGDVTARFVIGGENLLWDHVAFWRTHATRTVLVNEYGPTETVVGCCVYEVQDHEPPPGPLPIGRPIANTQLYVLDEAMRPVPVGVPGELYIGGAGVARGYLNQPELTERHFVADPFSNDPDAWLYRTGDVVKFLPSLDLQCLGRTDAQVKIRGFRVEPDEVAAALAEHPEIAQCVVVARGAEAIDRHLVAYFTLRTNGDLPVDEVRRFLEARLPDHMVPGRFVTLEEMPLTTNGKIDRDALPEPGRSRPLVEDSYVAPRTPVEHSLAEIWKDVLEIDRIGIDDSFFDLGGDSLRSVPLAERLSATLGRDIPVVALFQYPTIRSLVAFVSEAGPPPPARDAARDRADLRRRALAGRRSRRQQQR